MGKITVEVKINTFGTMLYSLNHPNVPHQFLFALDGLLRHFIIVIFSTALGKLDR